MKQVHRGLVGLNWDIFQRNGIMYRSRITYSCHVISEVHIMTALEIRKWVGQPHHVNIIIHDIVTQLQDLKQMPWPP